MVVYLLRPRLQPNGSTVARCVCYLCRQPAKSLSSQHGVNRIPDNINNARTYVYTAPYERQLNALHYFLPTAVIFSYFRREEIAHNSFCWEIIEGLKLPQNRVEIKFSLEC